MDWLSLLQQNNLPAIYAAEENISGITGIHVEFSRELSQSEWKKFIEITNPIEHKIQAAKEFAAAIPLWAAWTQEDALTWTTDNIAIPLTTARTTLNALSGTLTMAIFKTAMGKVLDILDKMWVLQKANMQMTLALRDETWSGLPDIVEQLRK